MPISFTPSPRGFTTLGLGGMTKVYQAEIVRLGCTIGHGVDVRSSSIAGNGLFVTRNFMANEIITGVVCLLIKSVDMNLGN